MTRRKNAGISQGILGEPLRVMNRLMAEGLLLDYAIGGGVATLYYTEPVLTYDFDIVCRFPGEAPLIGPSPVFAKLQEWGYRFGVEDRVMINGVPVQFIPTAPGLMEEALTKAMSVTVCGVETRILRAEYLAGIMLHLHRPKDRAKLDLLVRNDAVVFDRVLFNDIVRRYDLVRKWERFNEE